MPWPLGGAGRLCADGDDEDELFDAALEIAAPPSASATQAPA